MTQEPRGPRHKLHSRTSKMSFHDDDHEHSGGGNLFAWTIVILLLIGFAFACWIFSFYVFGHPEKAFSYSILNKLHKLEPLKRFEITAAPRGEFLSSAQLNDRYGKMTDRELERASETLLRNYVRNYKLTQDLVPYVVGSFNILDSYELKNDSIFPSGVVALAQSTDTPSVLLEHVFTADSRVVPTLQRTLLTGLDLKLDRTVDLSAIINVKRLPDGRLQFTAIPLLYGSYTSSAGPGIFSLDPPSDLNLDVGLPVLNDKDVNLATQKYSSYRIRAGLAAKNPSADGSTSKPQRPQAQLMRVARPETTAAVPVATPSPTPDDLPVRPAIPVTAGVASSENLPPEQATASPTPAQGAIANTSGSKWPLYSPGQMPRGRLISMTDADQFTENGVGDQRVYIQGNFVVTAAGNSQAVLRSNSALPETFGIGGRTTKVRIIVEYPAGSKPPSVGSTFSRDYRRPFLITDVRKTTDGEINVRAREITQGQ